MRFKIWFGSGSGAIYINLDCIFNSPDFLWSLSYKTSVRFLGSSFSTSKLNDTGCVTPSASSASMSLSLASNINFLPAFAYVSTWQRQNFSFQTACFPAPSFTSVLPILFSYLNCTYGSYLPIKSTSLINVASSMISSILQLLFSFGLRGGSGFFQTNSAINFRSPVFLKSLKRSTSKKFGASFWQRLMIDIVFATPIKSSVSTSLS